MTKFTTEQAEEQELYSLGEAIGSCLELTDDLIDRYCGSKVKEQLERLSSDQDRAYAIDGCIGEGRMVGYTNTGCGATEKDIVIPVGEIEVQFQGSPEKFFETPEDWAISGDLAYLCVGGAALFEIDVDGLREAVDDMLDIE